MTTLEEVKKLVEQTHAAARKKDLEMMEGLQKQVTEAQSHVNTEPAVTGKAARARRPR